MKGKTFQHIIIEYEIIIREIKTSELQVYGKDFGKKRGYTALVAEINGKIVGAVWARIMNDDGHIDNDTPLLAISLYKQRIMVLERP